MAVWFILLLIIYIFFRQELTKWATQSFQKYPYTMLILLLVGLSYFTWEKYDEMMGAVDFLLYNINTLQDLVAKALQNYFKPIQSAYTFNILVRALVFGGLLYFPEYYHKKYPSLVYKEQVDMVKRVCYLILLILVIVFSVLT